MNDDLKRRALDAYETALVTSYRADKQAQLAWLAAWKAGASDTDLLEADERAYGKVPE